MREDRTKCKERSKAARSGFSIFLLLPYPSGDINRHRPPEHMIGGGQRMEIEVDRGGRLTESGRVERK